MRAGDVEWGGVGIMDGLKIDVDGGAGSHTVGSS